MFQNGITYGTVVRTVMLIIALANQILTVSGNNPLPWSDEEVYQAITTILTVAASVCSWWKNNSFTMRAIEADKILHNE